MFCCCFVFSCCYCYCFLFPSNNFQYSQCGLLCPSYPPSSPTLKPPLIHRSSFFPLRIKAFSKQKKMHCEKRCKPLLKHPILSWISVLSLYQAAQLHHHPSDGVRFYLFFTFEDCVDLLETSFYRLLHLPQSKTLCIHCSSKCLQHSFLFLPANFFSFLRLIQASKCEILLTILFLF